MNLEALVLCRTGAVRKNNEDAALAYWERGRGLFLVADGMGGYAEGERASGCIAERMREWWLGLEPARYAGCEELVFEEAKHVLDRANEEIYRSTANGHICGSTVVLLLVWEKKSFLLSVGDSRCYLLPGGLFGGTLVRLTRDDVWENSAAAAGVRQKENHPDYGKLTNAVGIGTGVRYTACTDRPKAGGVYLLCSDGIHKYCAEETIQSSLRAAAGGNLQKAMGILEREVIRNGAKDNYSAVIVRVKKGNV